MDLPLGSSPSIPLSPPTPPNAGLPQLSPMPLAYCVQAMARAYTARKQVYEMHVLAPLLHLCLHKKAALVQARYYLTHCLCTGNIELSGVGMSSIMANIILRGLMSLLEAKRRSCAAWR